MPCALIPGRGEIRCPVGDAPRGTRVGNPAGRASIIPRSRRPVARRKPSEERGMGSASLIKAHEEETNGRAAPLRTAPRYIAGTGPSPDDAGWIRSGAIRSEFTRKSRILRDRYRSTPITPEASATTGLFARDWRDRSNQFMNEPL